MPARAQDACGGPTVREIAVADVGAEVVVDADRDEARVDLGDHCAVRVRLLSHQAARMAPSRRDVQENEAMLVACLVESGTGPFAPLDRGRLDRADGPARSRA